MANERWHRLWAHAGPDRYEKPLRHNLEPLIPEFFAGHDGTSTRRQVQFARQVGIVGLGYHAQTHRKTARNL